MKKTEIEAAIVVAVVASLIAWGIETMIDKKTGERDRNRFNDRRHIAGTVGLR